MIGSDIRLYPFYQLPQGVAKNGIMTLKPNTVRKFTCALYGYGELDNVVNGDYPALPFGNSAHEINLMVVNMLSQVSPTRHDNGHLARRHRLDEARRTAVSDHDVCLEHLPAHLLEGQEPRVLAALGRIGRIARLNVDGLDYQLAPPQLIDRPHQAIELLLMGAHGHEYQDGPLEYRSQVHRTRVNFQLLPPLHDEDVAEAADKAPSERRPVDTVENLDVDKLRPEQFAQREEGDGNRGSRADHQVGALLPDQTERESGVPDQVWEISVRGVVAVVNPLPAKPRVCIILVERNPEPIICMRPYRLQKEHVGEMAAARGRDAYFRVRKVHPTPPPSR